MANLDNNILAVLEPSILPTEIKLKSNGEEDGEAKQSLNIGSAVPFIDINGHQFRNEDIQNFNLEIGGPIPLLNITLRDTSGVFEAAQYPRDGDVVTVLINSKNPDIWILGKDYLDRPVEGSTLKDYLNEYNV